MEFGNKRFQFSDVFVSNGDRIDFAGDTADVPIERIEHIDVIRLTRRDEQIAGSIELVRSLWIEQSAAPS